MIALLNCSINLFANDNAILPTGERHNSNDSVLISYDDLRIANSKLIQLQYEKEINNELRNVVHNDSIVISEYEKENIKLKNDNDKAIKDKNTYRITSATLVAAFVVSTLIAILK